ncbi:hypothetical protein C8J57DRAFT_1721484 [Mycena rebaudengoi]|nr:hypothetical protein C8J57DRAFT_1721484 [Mycena rebaudengoi]
MDEAVECIELFCEPAKKLDIQASTPSATARSFRSSHPASLWHITTVRSSTPQPGRPAIQSWPNAASSLPPPPSPYGDLCPHQMMRKRSVPRPRPFPVPLVHSLRQAITCRLSDDAEAHPHPRPPPNLPRRAAAPSHAACLRVRARHPLFGAPERVATLRAPLSRRYMSTPLIDIPRAARSHRRRHSLPSTLRSPAAESCLDDDCPAHLPSRARVPPSLANLPRRSPAPVLCDTAYTLTLAKGARTAHHLRHDYYHLTRSILSRKQPSIPLRRKRTKKLMCAPCARSTPAASASPTCPPLRRHLCESTTPSSNPRGEGARIAIADGPPRVPVAAQWGERGDEDDSSVSRRPVENARSPRAAYIRTARPPVRRPALRWRFVGDVDTRFPGLSKSPVLKPRHGAPRMNCSMTPALFALHRELDA